MTETDFSMWDAQADEVSGLHASSRLALSVAAVEPLWSTLRVASTRDEFEHRMGLVEDGIASRVAAALPEAYVAEGIASATRHLGSLFDAHYADITAQALRAAKAGYRVTAGETAQVMAFPLCDIHKYEHGESVEARYDGKTTMGPWASMCEACFKQFGVGLGTGQGQKLELAPTSKNSSMQKGAPFAGYEDFDACVRANSDKNDPEAYCGKIKHQVEDGKTSAAKVAADLSDHWKQVIDNWEGSQDDLKANIPADQMNAAMAYWSQSKIKTSNLHEGVAGWSANQAGDPDAEGLEWASEHMGTRVRIDFINGDQDWGHFVAIGGRVEWLSERRAFEDDLAGAAYPMDFTGVKQIIQVAEMDPSGQEALFDRAPYNLTAALTPFEADLYDAMLSRTADLGQQMYEWGYSKGEDARNGKRDPNLDMDSWRSAYGDVIDWKTSPNSFPRGYRDGLEGKPKASVTASLPGSDYSGFEMGQGKKCSGSGKHVDSDTSICPECLQPIHPKDGVIPSHKTASLHTAADDLKPGDKIRAIRNQDDEVRPFGDGSQTTQGFWAGGESYMGDDLIVTEVKPDGTVWCYNPSHPHGNENYLWADNWTKVGSRKTASTIEWGESEWHDQGTSAWLDGIEGDVYPNEFKIDPEDKDWTWTVKPTSLRCEYPELYDAGSADTKEQAMKAAEPAMVKADKSYGQGPGRTERFAAKSNVCPKCGSNMEDVRVIGDKMIAKCDACGEKRDPRNRNPKFRQWHPHSRNHESEADANAAKGEAERNYGYKGYMHEFRVVKSSAKEAAWNDLPIGGGDQSNMVSVNGWKTNSGWGWRDAEWEDGPDGGVLTYQGPAYDGPPHHREVSNSGQWNTEVVTAGKSAVQALLEFEAAEGDFTPRELVEQPWMAAARQIVAEHQHQTVDGMILDAFTASMLIQVHDALSPGSAAKFASMPLARAVDIGWKLIQAKNSSITAGGRGNDFSISDAKNEEGEWIMSPEQIRAEMDYEPDEDDFYRDASLKTAKHQCAYGGDNHSDDLLEVYHGKAEPTYICGFHHQSLGIPKQSAVQALMEDEMEPHDPDEESEHTYVQQAGTKQQVALLNPGEDAPCPKCGKTYRVTEKGGRLYMRAHKNQDGDWCGDNGLGFPVRVGVREDQQGAERYQHTDPPGVPPWTNHWDDDVMFATQDMTDAGMNAYQKPNPFPGLTTLKDVRTAAMKIAGDYDGEDQTSMEEGGMDDLNAATGEAEVSTQPVTTKPRQVPEGAQMVAPPQPVMSPEPMLDMGTGQAQPQMGSGGGFDMGYGQQMGIDPMSPTVDQMVTAKVARIAQRVMMDNPSLDADEAKRLAALTVAKHPEMVKAPR